MSMYERAMGDHFERLSYAVKRFHRLAGRHVLHGRVRTDAPGSLPAMILALCLGSPRRACDGPIRFELNAQSECEVWSRRFPDRVMTSQLRLTCGRVVERLGAARLTFQLVEREGDLEMRLERLHFLGIRCPSWLMPKVLAQETGRENQLHFRVHASVPLIGVVASYSGFLDLAGEAAS